MLKFGRVLAWFAAVAVTGVMAQQEADVVRLQNAQPMENDGKVEVLEFFHYACGHCFALESRLQTWKPTLAKDVRFVQVPAAFELGGFNAAPIYYTLQAMGQLDKLHKKLFDAIHLDGEVIGNKATFNKWLAKNGIDPAKYAETAASFSVDSRVKRATQLTNMYKIASVPTMVVAGKYAVRGSDSQLQTVDRLIAETRKDLKGAAVVPAAQTPAKPATKVASKPTAKAPVKPVHVAAAKP